MRPKVLKPLLVHSDGTISGQVYDLPLQEDSIWNDAKYFPQDKKALIKKNLIEMANKKFSLPSGVFESILNMIMYHIPLNMHAQLPIPDGVWCIPSVFVEDTQGTKYFMHDKKNYDVWLWCSRTLDVEIQKRETELNNIKRSERIQSSYPTVSSNTFFTKAFELQKDPDSHPFGCNNPFSFFEQLCTFSLEKPAEIAAKIVNRTWEFK